MANYTTSKIVLPNGDECTLKDSKAREDLASLTPANLGAKATQSAVSSPAASGTAVAFIDSISQNEQGVISPTKKTVAGASQSAAGLMSANDKTKMDGMGMISYGTCTTAANAQVKEVTIANSNWQLKVGSVIGVKFTNTNTYNATASAPVKLNVNSTGEKQIYYSSTATPTGSNTTAFGYANTYRYYMYDGTYWVFMGLNYHDNAYTSAYCSTGAGTAAKTASCSGYSLLAKSYLHVIVTNANTAASALTLNVNGRGAKPIYINGVASSSSNYTLPAGSYIVYYDGTNYYFRTDGKLTADITGNAGSVNGHTVGVDVPSDAKFTDTTYSSKTAASGGTDVSLVTTGEKYTWNSKTSNTGTVTSIATGAGLTGGTITGSGTIKAKLRSETALTNDSAAAAETSDRVYPVAVDKSGYLAVNVPWVDTNTQTITGVKGNAESTYRTGNVNLTPANIGAFGAGSVGAITNANNTSLYGSGIYSASACTNLPTNESGVFYQVEFFGRCQMAFRFSVTGIRETWGRYYTNNQWYPWVRIDKVTGVKGDAESTYRTGDVNLTAANIGAPETITMLHGAYAEWSTIYNRFVSIPEYSVQNIYMDSAVVSIVTANANTPIDVSLFGTIVRTTDNDISSVHIFARSFTVSDIFSISLIGMTASSQGTTNIYKISGTQQ